MKIFKKKKFEDAAQKQWHPNIKELEQAFVQIRQEVNSAAKEGKDIRSVAKQNIDTTVNHFFDAPLKGVTNTIAQVTADKDEDAELSAEEQRAADKEAYVNKRSAELLHTKGITNALYTKQIATNEFNRIHTRLEAQGIDVEKDLPVTRNNMDKKYVFLALLAFLTVAEMPMTYDILQALLSVQVWMLYTLCMLVAFMFGFSAHFYTKGLFRKDKKAAHKALSIGIVTLVFQVVARVMGGEGNQFLLILLQIATFMTAIVAAHWAGKYRDVFDGKEQLDKFSAIIVDANIQIDNEQHDIDHINEVDYERELNRDEREAIQQKKAAGRGARKIIEELQAQEQFLKEEAGRQKTNGYALVEEAYQSGRNKSANRFKVAKNAAMSLLLALAISSCSTPQSHKTYVGVDKSVSEVFSATNSTQAISNYIINKQCRLNDEAHLYDDCTIHIGFVGQSERPQTFTLELPAGNANPLMRVKKNRKAQVAAYIKRIPVVIDSMVNQVPADHQLTHYAMAQASFLARLAVLDTTIDRKLIMLSDGRETGVVNFNSYRSSKAFRADFEHIATIIDAQHNPGDLAGISVVFVTSPNEPHHVVTSQDIAAFWKYYIEKIHHGKFTALSNL